MASGSQGGFFRHGLDAAGKGRAEELGQETCSLQGGDDLSLGMAAQQFRHGGAMVGFHMLDDHIGQRLAGQGGIQAAEELVRYRFIHAIEQDGLFILDQIGIISYAAGERVDIFK